MLPLEIPERIRLKYEGKFPIPVVAVAKDLGLHIFESHDFQETQSGSIVKEGGNYIIYLHSDHPAPRKRLSIAREIGHFLKHKQLLDQGTEFVDTIFQPNTSDTNRCVVLHRRVTLAISAEQKTLEREADQFAADLLMPYDEFKKVFEVSNTMENVAHYFKVTVSAATIRAVALFGLFIS